MQKLLILWLLSFALSANAQTMATIIQTMPDSILPQLTRNNRLDFIDYMASNMKAETSNRLGGKSEMTELSDTYTNIRLSESAEVAFKLLTTNTGDKVIMQIYTYTLSDSLKVSQPIFYTTGWQIDTPCTYLPDFINHHDSNTAYQLTAHADNSNLEVRQSKVVVLEPYDEKNISSTFKRFSSDSTPLTWNGKTFQKE